MQLSFWIQQLLVLGLKLEKPRKDYHELVGHHLVTLWLIMFVISLIILLLFPHLAISWSYFVNLTYLGNAIFISMDVPDTFLAVSGSSFSAFPR